MKKITKDELPKILLASRSPRRSAILQALGVPFHLVDSHYQENPEDVLGLPPIRQAAQLALYKALATDARQETVSTLTIGSDTIVVLGSKILGKPKHRDDAQKMLQSLSGTTHEVMTGLALVCSNGETATCTERTRVTFRSLSPHEIEWYLNTGDPFDKAGAYAIQNGAALFVEKIDGCYFNVVGFPVVALDRLFGNFGRSLIDFIEAGRKP